MSATVKPISSFDIVKHMVKSMPVDTIQVRMMNDVSNIVWMAAPWRWTIGSLTNVTLTTAQDYTVTLPADFLFVQEVLMTDGDKFRTLHVEPSLPTTEVIKGTPSAVSIQGTTTLRVMPPFGAAPPVTNTLVALYKKKGPVFTRQNLSTTGGWILDDEWVWVIEEGLLWRSYFYADDSRCGSAQVDATGKATYSGQRAIFQAAIEAMKAGEKMPSLSRYAQEAQ